MAHKNTKTLFSALNNLTTGNHRATAETALLTRLQESETEALKYNPYMMDEFQANLLATVGIQASPFATEIHRHPMHKAIENYLLLEFVSHLLDSNTTVAFQKPAKYHKLINTIREKYPQKNLKTELINPINTVKDHLRYRPSAAGNIINTANPTLFLHDAIHFYSPAQVAQLFFQNPNLDHIVCTTVIPIETTIKADSLYPELYSLQYTQDGVLYIPEGHHAGAYHQPLSASWLLTTNQIQAFDHRNVCHNFSIQLVESVFAHHLLFITRRKVKVLDQYRTYDGPKLAVIPDIFPAFPISRRLVPYKMLDKLLNYASAVKTNSELNLESKLRFLVEQDKYKVSQSTKFLLMHFVHKLTDVRRKMSPRTNLEEQNPLYRAFESQFGAFIHYGEHSRMERFLSVLDVTEFTFTFKLHQVYLTHSAVLAGAHETGFSFKLDPTDQTFSLVREDCDTKADELDIFFEAHTHEEDLLPTSTPKYRAPKTSSSTSPQIKKVDPMKRTKQQKPKNKRELTSRRPGQCGLVAFENLGFSRTEVQRAYDSARRQVLNQLGESEPREEFENFQNTNANTFPWLSGTELVYIGAALGVQINLHTPAHCHISNEDALNIYHVGDNHWTSTCPHDHIC